MSPFCAQLLLHSDVKLHPEHWLRCCARLSLVMAHNILAAEIIFIRFVRSEGQKDWLPASKCASLRLLVRLVKLFAHLLPQRDPLHLNIVVFVCCFLNRHVHIVFRFIDFILTIMWWMPLTELFKHYCTWLESTRSTRTTGSDSCRAANHHNFNYWLMCRLFSPLINQSFSV